MCVGVGISESLDEISSVMVMVTTVMIMIVVMTRAVS